MGQWVLDNGVDGTFLPDYLMVDPKPTLRGAFFDPQALTSTTKTSTPSTPALEVLRTG